MGPDETGTRHARPGFRTSGACAVPQLALWFWAGVFCARQAALRYSLIKPWTTWVRLMLAVTPADWPGSRSGGRCFRDWCGRCSF